MSDVTELQFRFPNREQHPSVRTTDPDTCVEPDGVRIGKGCTLVLLCLAAHEGGLTDFEIGEHVGLQQTSAGKRRLDLSRVVPPLVMGTTERRPSPSGSPAIVWKITPQGVAYAQRLNEEVQS